MIATSTINQALIPQLLSHRGHKVTENLFSIFFGIIALALLAKISLPLPWTPVPVTGQTFGVMLIALLWGRKRSIAIVFSYLVLGYLGLPIFALGKTGALLGPTLGYLFGMLVSSLVVGYLADQGWTKKLYLSFLATLIGTLCVYAFGVAGLAFFLPRESLLAAGLLPFIPGDLIKNIVASLTAYSFAKSLKSK